MFNTNQIQIQNSIIKIPTIPIIEEFLKQWKEKTFIYYKNVIAEIERLQSEYNETLSDYNRLWCVDKFTNEEKEIIKKNHDQKWKLYNTFCQNHNSVKMAIYGLLPENYDQAIEKVLNKEVITKYKNLIFRITKKAGNIIDASSLYIGSTGEINGKIVGDIKTVTVETISAGGYNIQCYHFRILVK